MPISNDELRNALFTTAAYADAISVCLGHLLKWEPISTAVTGVRGPTYAPTGGDPNGEPVGMCIPSGITPEPAPETIADVTQLADTQQRLAHYLRLLAENV